MTPLDAILILVAVILSGLLPVLLVLSVVGPIGLVVIVVLGSWRGAVAGWAGAAAPATRNPARVTLRALSTGSPATAPSSPAATAPAPMLHGAHRGARLVAAAAIVALVVAGCGASAAPLPTLGGTVRVMEAWQGQELDAFMAMVRPFEARTGTRVLFTSTRDLVGETRRAVNAGDPPDIVGLPNPLEIARLAHEGILHDLSGAVDVDAYKASNPPALVQLGTVDDTLVGVFVKASVKGLIWYDPQNYRMAIPDTFDELTSGDHGQTDPTKLWCAGFGSGATSGWPGTDWIEDILLRQSGPDAYDAWTAGRLPWTSPQVRRAFRTFGLVVAPSVVQGGTAKVADGDFETAGDPLFTRPPGCLFLHQGSFMPAFFPAGSTAGTDYDFFPFPTINPRYGGSVIGGGDIFGMLRDTPQARALLGYLVTPEAQSILVAQGSALSANALVRDYPDSVSRRMADVLIGASLFRFDASDLMPDQMSSAFNWAVLDFVRDQSRLDALLTDLDRVADGAYRG